MVRGPGVGYRCFRWKENGVIIKSVINCIVQNCCMIVCIMNCLHSGCHRFNKMQEASLTDIGPFNMLVSTQLKKPVCDYLNFVTCSKHGQQQHSGTSWSINDADNFMFL